MKNDTYDCIVIGGGIAGLTAGIYLSRFNCKVCIIDNNESRASLITRSYNFPACPSGISGNEILTKLRNQYNNYQQTIIKDTVKSIIKNKNSSLFTVKGVHSSFKAKFIILATGVIDLEPSIPNLSSAIKDGLIRHCLICDGYEASGKKILVIGDNKSCIKNAFLLKSYTDDLTILTVRKLKFTATEQRRIKTSKVKIIDGKDCAVIMENKKIKSIQTKSGMLEFDVIYSALGACVRSELGIKLGAQHDRDDSLIVNHHQETSIKGLYAAGDVVKGINQMCVATSQGATAAIAIFNKLKGW